MDWAAVATERVELENLVAERRTAFAAAKASPAEGRAFLVGRQACYRAIRQVMEAADSRFDCAALAQGAMARASRWGFVGFVRGLAERGVKMRVMTAWAPAMEVEARRLAVLAEVRSLTLSKPARFFVRDGREALFFLTDDPSLGLDVPSEEAVRTTEAEDVRKLVETFEALWLVARPLTP